MTGYSDLLAKAERHTANRFAFEKASVEKAIQLHNALIEELDIPQDAIRAPQIKARESENEVQISDEYILSNKGLGFAIQVQFGRMSLSTMFYIEPKGDRLVLKMDGRDPIDVTDRTGIVEWCDWMERVFEQRLDQTLGGRLSTMMSAKPTP